MSKYDAFQVSLTSHVLSGLVSRFPRFWKWLGNMETKVLAEDLSAFRVDRPIFISGLARSGTTILLEAIAKQPEIATHKYRDFPWLFTPYFWGKGHRTGGPSHAEERAHGDRLMVTADSPEAMEEMLWMAYFQDAHNPCVSNVLDEKASNPSFETFYRDHIRKLMFTRGVRRYAAKGNYHITRLAYLLKMFPDAKFILPVRHPRNTIASLMKQHKLFQEGERKYPRSLKHMRQVGHFEFGLDLRFINTGDLQKLEEIEELISSGQEVRGWARYWSTLYRFLADQLNENEALRRAAYVLRYEDLCDNPQETFKQAASHCEFDAHENFTRFADTIEAPTYYKTNFTDEEMLAIEEETASTAAMFGYGSTESAEPHNCCVLSAD
jgi:hypothetical protein